MLWRKTLIWHRFGAIKTSWLDEPRASHRSAQNNRGTARLLKTMWPRQHLISSICTQSTVQADYADAETEPTRDPAAGDQLPTATR